MKLGLIARAEDRGLGIQTWEAARHLQPERVLVIDVQNAEGFPMHLDRYPGATVARLNPHGMDGTLNESLVRSWMEDLDVVLSCETLYDWRIATWARDQGVATVVQVNPEFYLHGKVDLPHPTAWWNPTTWRMEHLPAGTRHVPVPVALDRWEAWPEPPTVTNGPLRALHVVGRRAVADRNGTETLTRSLRGVHDVTLTTLEQRPKEGHAGVADYWQLYAGQDVLVMPRRFGGLCLPVQEAMAAGLAVVMPGCPPNKDWPIVEVKWSWRGQLPVPCGTIPLAATDQADLASRLRDLAGNDLLLYAARSASLAWAATHSWDALLPLYQEELARAAETVPSRW